MPFNPYMFNPRGFDPNQDYGISNPVPRMRQKSIFDRPTSPEEDTKRFLSQVNPVPRANFSQPSQDDTDSEGGKYYDEMMRRSKPGPAVNAYQAALKEQPTDENTHVSTARKIMGTIAGAAGGFAHGPGAGAQAANEIIDSPYKTAMRDYSVRMKNLGESAKLEQDDQSSQLNAMKAARDYGLKFSEYKDKQRMDEFERNYKSGTLDVARGNLESNSDYRKRMAEAAGSNATSNAQRTRDAGRNIDSEISNRTGMLGVAQQNAGTAAKAQQATAKYQDATTEWRKTNGKKVSPAQQNYAMDVAFRQLGMDPRYKEFVKPNDKSGYWETIPEKMDGSALADDFRRKAKQIIQHEIDKSSPYDDEEEADPMGGSSGSLTWGLKPTRR